MKKLKYYLKDKQLESGCSPLIKDYSKYDNIYDIAYKNLMIKKFHLF